MTSRKGPSGYGSFSNVEIADSKPAERLTNPVYHGVPMISCGAGNDAGYREFNHPELICVDAPCVLHVARRVHSGQLAAAVEAQRACVRAHISPLPMLRAYGELFEVAWRLRQVHCFSSASPSTSCHVNTHQN